MELLEVIYSIYAKRSNGVRLAHFMTNHAYFQYTEDMESFVKGLKNNGCSDGDIEVNIVTVALRSRGEYRALKD